MSFSSFGAMSSLRTVVSLRGMGLRRRHGRGLPIPQAVTAKEKEDVSREDDSPKRKPDEVTLGMCVIAMTAIMFAVACAVVFLSALSS